MFSYLFNLIIYFFTLLQLLNLDNSIYQFLEYFLCFGALFRQKKTISILSSDICVYLHIVFSYDFYVSGAKSA